MANVRDTKTGRYLKTGRSYANCHPDKFLVARGLCHSCYRREWLRTHPEQYKRRLAQSQKWRDRNREYLRAYSIRKNKEKYWRDPDAHYVLNVTRRLGITVADYHALVARFKNRCGICGRARGSALKRLGVDHCHTTGKVRGLLCAGCNALLGKFESEKWQTQIKNYLNDIPNAHLLEDTDLT